MRSRLSEAWEVARDLATGRYPAFVTGGPLPAGHVPVFVFHSVEPVDFGRKLDYLAANRYTTLSADEYLDVVRGRRAAPERAVLLTFDDGRGSLWSVAYPLLKRRGMRGVVFLVPGRTPSRPGGRWPTWDDAVAGRADRRDVLDREARDGGAFLTWEEVADLTREGVFDFHSHTLRHARIHVAPRLAGFVTPDSRRGTAAMDVPLLAGPRGDLLAEAAPLGTPLLRSQPRTSEALRFFEDASAREATVRAVEEGGGTRFFEQPGWRRTLARLVPQPIPGRFETPAEREAAIRHELAEARRLIEERTERPAVYLCYPWHASGPTAERLAREAGYVAAFGGKVTGTPLTRPGDDPWRIARVGEDYLERLPGDGRTSLARILSRKAGRRRSRMQRRLLPPGPAE